MTPFCQLSWHFIDWILFSVYQRNNKNVLQNLKDQIPTLIKNCIADKTISLKLWKSQIPPKPLHVIIAVALKARASAHTVHSCLGSLVGSDESVALESRQVGTADCRNSCCCLVVVLFPSPSPLLAALCEGRKPGLWKRLRAFEAWLCCLLTL